MPDITIHITRSNEFPTLVSAVRPVTGQSIADIKSCIDNNIPIFTCELFLNDFADVADTLRQLVSALNEIDVEYIICESGDVIDLETLLNTLEGSQEYRF